MDSSSNRKYFCRPCAYAVGCLSANHLLNYTNKLIDVCSPSCFYHCTCEPAVPGLPAALHSVPAQHLPEALLGRDLHFSERHQWFSFLPSVQRSRSAEICPAGRKKQFSGRILEILFNVEVITPRSILYMHMYTYTSNNILTE